MWCSWPSNYVCKLCLGVVVVVTNSIVGIAFYAAADLMLRYYNGLCVCAAGFVECAARCRTAMAAVPLATTVPRGRQTVLRLNAALADPIPTVFTVLQVGLGIMVVPSPTSH